MRSRSSRRVTHLACSAALLVWLHASVSTADVIGSTTAYVRTDSDHTTVISPRLRVDVTPLADTRVAVVYAVDVWSSASIDIRASATQRVTERRDEIGVSIDQTLSNITLSGRYRFSTEVDYTSHGGSGALRYALADGATVLSASGDASRDVVGRAGDPSIARGLQRYGARLSLEQALDPNTLMSGGYELGVLSGYQASPYRFVGFGGDGLGCQGALVCLTEHVPDLRVRHAFTLQARRALSRVTSIGLGYRFYVDDWALAAHTMHASLAWLPDHHSTLSLRLRAHTQSAASLYRSRYALTQQIPVHYSRDRELSSLVTLRAGIDYVRTFDLGADVTLTLSSAAAVALYRYAEFVGLNQVRALEVTAMAEVRL